MNAKKTFSSRLAATARKVARAACALALGAATLAGCGSAGQQQAAAKTAQLDPNNPVTITVWHYYNGAQQASFDELVSEFNATEGKEKGIYVEGYSQGSISDLEKAVTASAAGEVGSQDLPDVFSSYADTAYSIQQEGKLADLSQYLTADDLSAYVDSYLQEGRLNGDDGLYLFPVAKSTEVMMVNKTDWEAFAEATGTTTDELATEEGIARVAKRYYEWTDAQTPDVPNDGRAFYGRDSMSNYFVLGLKQMGTDVFEVKDGKATVNVPKDQVKRLWDCYYVPYVNGYYSSAGKFRSDDVKTGEILAYTGSTASSMYFPDQVVGDDSSRPIDYLVLPAPVMEGGEDVQIQQGAGMAVTKSDDAHEYASVEFLKWFTQKENNLRFVADSAYLPVRKDANSIQALDEVIQKDGLQIAPKAHDCLESVLEKGDSQTYYASETFPEGYAARKVLDTDLKDKAVADRKAVQEAIAGGASHDDAVAPYVSDAAFDAWYDEFTAALDSAANPS